MKQMKRVLFLPSMFFVLFSCLLLSSVVQAAPTETIKPSVNPFTNIETDGPMQLTVAYGEKWAVRVELTEQASQWFSFEQKGERIVFKVRKSYGRLRPADIQIHIMMPKLESLALSGASAMTIEPNFPFSSDFNIRLKNASNLVFDRCKTNTVFMELSGASHIEGIFQCHMASIDLSGASSYKGALQSDQLFCDLSGASSIKMNGKCQEMKVECSGASSIKGDSFTATQVNLALSGASSIRLVITDTISGKISGASSLYYGGSPTMNIEFSSICTVHKL